MGKTVAISVSALLVGFALALGIVRQTIQAQPAPEFHEHVDFAVFLNGERFDFARHEFMSNVPCSITKESWWGIDTALAHGDDFSDAIHLHDSDGGTIHLHQAGLTMHNFFETLDMQFDDFSFADHEGNRYENNEVNHFRFFVNNEEVTGLADREIANLDRILITYGPRDRTKASIDAELAQVGSRACIFSGDCSHRGTAPLESCGAAGEKPSALLQWLGV
jgi:hypothetical protein